MKNVIISKITYLNTLPSGGGEGRVLLVFVLGTSLRGGYGATDGSGVEAVDDVDCWDDLKHIRMVIKEINIHVYTLIWC